MAGQHVIYRQILDITFTSREEALSGQEAISNIYHNDLLPLINEIFDGVLGDDEVIRIDSITLDLGTIAQNSLKEELIARLRKQLIDKLKKEVQTAGILAEDSMPLMKWLQENLPEGSTRTERVSELELLAYFLQTGILPWWARKSKMGTNERLVNELVRKQPDALKSILEALVQHSLILRRLTYQLPDSSLQLLVTLWYPYWRNILPGVLADIQSTVKSGELPVRAEIEVREWCWEVVFKHVTKHYFTPDFPEVPAQPDSSVTQLVFRFIEDAATPGKHKELVMAMQEKRNWVYPQFPKILLQLEKFYSKRKEGVVENAASKKKAKKAKEVKVEVSSDTILPRKPFPVYATPGTEEDIMIHNAGMVILWPFLETLFTGLSLMENKEFVSASATHRAALLLNYLVTKETVVPEYELILCKVLCGFPTEEPLPAAITLSPEEEEECENLLNVVAVRWTALKGTSGEAMRQTFLQKDGLLKQQENGWYLRIERATVDILVDKLPWGISIIRLPWTEKILYVEW